MGLFDFLKKKENAKKTGKPEIENKKVADTNTPEIEIHSIDNGSHGDNFGGLVGFHYLRAGDGEKLISETVALSSMKHPVLKNQFVSIREVGFDSNEEENRRLGIRTLQFQDKIISAYPYLRTNYTIPFTTKQIFEWSHIGNMEAEIKGGGRNTFGFGFYATDYGVNKNIYKENKNLRIRVSAFGLVLDKSEITEIGGQKISKDFTTYMPSKDILRPTYYDFIGVLLEFEKIKITDDNLGYIIKVKLITEENNPDFFTVEMFINKENMRIENLEKGMKIGGALWFQGEIE